MYLHVGNQKNIRVRRIIGIFDMDTSTVSSTTRAFLSNAQKGTGMESASNDELPKSFVVYEGRFGRNKVCLSQLSTSALSGRLDETENIGKIED